MMADLPAWRPLPPQSQTAQTKSPNGPVRLISPLSGPVTKEDLATLQHMLGYSPKGPSPSERNAMGPVNYLRRTVAGISSRVHNLAAYNDRGDAVRHAEWSAKMTGAMGGEAAKAYGDSHERDEEEWNQAHLGEMYMDLINNHNGRILRSKFPKMAGDELAEWAADRGLLQVKPLELGGN